MLSSIPSNLLGKDVGGLIDVLIAKVGERLKYGKIIRKDSSTITLLLNKDDLKRMFKDSMSSKNPNPMLGGIDKFIDVDIKNNMVEVSIKIM